MNGEEVRGGGPGGPTPPGAFANGDDTAGVYWEGVPRRGVGLLLKSVGRSFQFVMFFVAAAGSFGDAVPVRGGGATPGNDGWNPGPYGCGVGIFAPGGT